MGLRAIELRSTYDTSDPSQDPLQEFLEPCLANSIRYDRLSGFFSSRILALAAKGLGTFLTNDGVMRLVMSSQMTPGDFKALQLQLANGDDYSHLFDSADFNPSSLADAMERSHFEAMCWLLAKNRLEIKISIYQGGQSDKAVAPIFHPKIGIFFDEAGDAVSFSGSINETAFGWAGNAEEFKVFKSWEPGTTGFVAQDSAAFDRHWNNTDYGNFVTVPLSKALKEKLISYAPEDAPHLKRSGSSKKGSVRSFQFRDYQDAAIAAWCDADYLGILAMATGTGKTKTARGCIDAILEKGDTFALITAPYEHIALQWVEELSDLDPILVSGSSGWKEKLQTAANRRSLGRRKHIVLVSVQNSAASASFIQECKGYIDSFAHKLFVGDEAHGLGASAYQNAMQDFYQYRLGLSATPARYFDEIGTAVLEEYFSGTVYEFSTSKALAWRDPLTGQRALCDYRYEPRFVDMAPDEITEYDKLSEKIAKMSGEDGDKSKQEALEKLLFARAAIIKTARSKLVAFRTYVEARVDQLDYCLVYCHNFEQLQEVGQILYELGVSYQKITGDESTRPSKEFGGKSEREWILSQFASGTTRTLLAIKCLDEGVDIPAARLGLILASSGNTREFIQRRGRLLRPSPSKPFAEVIDFVVSPGNTSNSVGFPVEVFKKELKRIIELSTDALNFEDVKLLVAEKIAEMDS